MWLELGWFGSGAVIAIGLLVYWYLRGSDSPRQLRKQKKLTAYIERKEEA